MGKGLWEKTMRFLGFGDDSPEEEEDLPTELPEEDIIPSRNRRLVPLPTATQMKVTVVSPSRFEEAQEIANHLKNRRPVILNLEKAEKETGSQILTFLSGVIYALNGQMQKVGSGIFLLTPSNVEIAAGPASFERVGDYRPRRS